MTSTNEQALNTILDASNGYMFQGVGELALSVESAKLIKRIFHK